MESLGNLEALLGQECSPHREAGKGLGVCCGVGGWTLIDGCWELMGRALTLQQCCELPLFGLSDGLWLTQDSF